MVSAILTKTSDHITIGQIGEKFGTQANLSRRIFAICNRRQKYLADIFTEADSFSVKNAPDPVAGEIPLYQQAIGWKATVERATGSSI